MPVAITGAKYPAASLSAVGVSTVTVSTSPFWWYDFNRTRLLGLFTAAGVFKGLTWARSYVSTNQIQLERPFFDPCTQLNVAQVVGDQLLVSKDFSESVAAGIAVSNQLVTITDTVTFGVADNQMGVCFYDENKSVSTTSLITISGGLTVFGKIDDVAKNSVSSPVDVLKNSGNSIVLNVNNSAANFFGNGGKWDATYSPAYFNASSCNSCIFNKVECKVDITGAFFPNPARAIVRDCFSSIASYNSICVRWGNGTVQGGSYKIANNSSGPISIFGYDSPGTYVIAANPSTRSVVLDMGNGPALVRSGSPYAILYNFTNLITTDYRSVVGASGGLYPNNNGVNTFRFSDAYTNLQQGTVGVVLNTTGAIEDSIAASGTSWAPSLLRRTCVGAAVTVNSTSWTYGFKKYGYQAIGGSIAPSVYDLGTAGQADNVAFGGLVNQLADSAVTLTQAQAAALAQINTLDQLYDAAINWGTANVSNAQYPSLSAYPAAANGAALDLGSRNIVIDGAAASAFAINTATHTITIKSSALASGAKFKSLTTTGTVTTVSGGTITAPYQDTTGVRASITNLDPQGFGTTWAFGWITTANWTGRNTAQPPAAWSGWNQSSGTGNSTQVTLAPATEYQLFLRIPGYYAPIGPIATIDTSTQTSVSLPVIVDTDLAGNSLWPQTAAHTTQAANFAYDYGDQVVEYSNQTGATEYISFLAAFRALELIAKAPAMAYQLVQPLYVNGTKDGFTLPRTNPLKARMSDASTGGGILQADIAYSDNQAKAFDRFLANPQNTGNFLLIPQATAIVSSGIVSDIRSGLALEASVQTRASQASVNAFAAINQTEHDSTQAAIAAIPSGPTLAQIEASTVLAKESTVASRASQVRVEALGSPLQASAYTAPVTPPTAVQNATAVRMELATELGKIDVATSTRLATAGYTAPTAAPTAAANATAVRAELATELGRIDAAVSSRLASAGYTAPDNAGIAAVKAKTDALPAQPAAVGSEMTLTAAYDSAKAAASQASVTALGSPAQAVDLAALSTANQAEHDATQSAIASVKTKTDVLINGPSAADVWDHPSRTLNGPLFE